MTRLPAASHCSTSPKSKARSWRAIAGSTTRMARMGRSWRSVPRAIISSTSFFAPPSRIGCSIWQCTTRYIENSPLFWADRITTPLVREVARRWGVLDLPGERKVHATATPLFGGVAVYGAFAVTVLANFDFSRGLKGVAVGGTIVVVVGLLDDLTDLPAWLKLLGQIAAASTAIAYGVILDTLPSWIPGVLWLNVILTVLWFLTITNAIQFLDGMDGLAAGLGVVAGIFFSIVSLQTGQRYLMFLSAALVGACLGFLPYNFRPGGATIFLGDSGASFIGFTLAGLAAMGVWADNNPVASLFTPTLILGVPLFDIAFVGTVRVVTSTRPPSLHASIALASRFMITWLIFAG